MSSLGFAIVCSPMTGLHMVRVSKEATPAMLVQLNDLLLHNKIQMKDEPKNPKALQYMLSRVLAKTPTYTSTALVFLRQGLGGKTVHIVPFEGFGAPNPPAINPLARKQHQKELFILLSLIFQRLKIMCPEDLKFMILNYLTADVVVNGRMCVLDFDVLPGGAAP